MYLFSFFVIAVPTVPVSSKSECDKLRASIANIRAEIRKEHMTLQQIVSNEQGSPLAKVNMKFCRKYLWRAWTKHYRRKYWKNQV